VGGAGGHTGGPGPAGAVGFHPHGFLSGLAPPGVPSSDSRGAWPPRAWGRRSGRCVVVALAARGAYGLDRRAACLSVPWRSRGIWPLGSPWRGLSIRDTEPGRHWLGSPERTARVGGVARLVPTRGGEPDNWRAPPRCPPAPCRYLPVAAHSRGKGKTACRDGAVLPRRRAQGMGTICSAAVRSVERKDGEQERRAASGTEGDGGTKARKPIKPE
jgi:hypothetical protein